MLWTATQRGAEAFSGFSYDTRLNSKSRTGIYLGKRETSRAQKLGSPQFHQITGEEHMSNQREGLNKKRDHERR